MRPLEMLSMFVPLTIFLILLILVVGLIFLLRDDKELNSMQMSKSQIIKTVYFYLVSLIALMMVVFSTADLVNLGLKTWIFPKADQQEYREPPCKFMVSPGPEASDTEEAYEARIAECEANKIDPEEAQAIRNQRDAVRDISFLFVGIPLFLYHWIIIRREQKKG